MNKIERVRINCNLPKNTYDKLIALQKLFSKDVGIDLDVTKTLIKLINDTDSTKLCD